MSLKKDELCNPRSCLNKAASDEPVFVLRAKDPLAAMAVRHWATMSLGTHEPAKLKEANELAGEMELYRIKNFPSPPKAEDPPRS